MLDSFKSSHFRFCDQKLSPLQVSTKTNSAAKCEYPRWTGTILQELSLGPARGFCEK